MEAGQAWSEDKGIFLEGHGVAWQGQACSPQRSGGSSPKPQSCACSWAPRKEATGKQEMKTRSSNRVCSAPRGTVPVNQDMAGAHLRGLGTDPPPCTALRGQLPLSMGHGTVPTSVLPDFKVPVLSSSRLLEGRGSRVCLNLRPWLKMMLWT